MSSLHQREAAWSVDLAVGGAAFSVEQKQGASSRPRTVTSLGTGGLLFQEKFILGGEVSFNLEGCQAL